jgi:hypothetical protein
MKVLLASVGNPDFGQNPNQEMYGCEPNHKVEIDSFEKASLLCQKFIARNELGGGNWAGGLITDGRKPIAYVSYNGRVWKITKDAPMYSGKNEEIKLDPEKLESCKVIFTHVSTTTPYGDKCSRFEYVDQHGRKFVFRDTNKPWEYKLILPTHEDFQNVQALNIVVGQYDYQAITKTDHEGKPVPDGTLSERHHNAIKKLIVVL